MVVTSALRCRHVLPGREMNARWLLVTNLQGAGFNAADQLGDAAILGERLVVEEPTQLLGEVGDGALHRIARFQPVVQHVADLFLGGIDCRQRHHLFQQLVEFVLAR